MNFRDSVLVIEDDDDVRGLIATRLRLAGYSVVTAATGEAGLEAARAEPPALVILDLLLPGIDGWQVLDALRGDERFTDTAVLVVSVLDRDQYPDRIDGYIVKPFRGSQLEHSVGEILKPPKTEARS